MTEKQKIYVVKRIKTRKDDLDCDIIGHCVSYDRAREIFVEQLIEIKELYLTDDYEVDPDDDDDALYAFNHYCENKYHYELDEINSCIEDNNIKFYKFHHEDFNTQIKIQIEELYIDE